MIPILLTAPRGHYQIMMEKNGQPTHTAVDSYVYNLSQVFDEGVHKSDTTGQNLLETFHSYYAVPIRKKYPKIGTYTP